MLVSPIQNPDPVNYQTAFPNVSFPSSGPTQEFLDEYDYAFVQTEKPYDTATQKLVSVAPYYEAPYVYTVVVENKTPEDYAREEAAAKQNNKQQASQLLSATDWTAIPSVADPAQSNPFLANQAAFFEYRNQLRAIAVNPPVVVESWPVEPDEVWETVTP